MDRIRAEVEAEAEAARHSFRSSGARSGESKGAKEKIEIGRRTIELANTITVNEKLKNELKTLGKQLQKKGGGDRHLLIALETCLGAVRDPPSGHP